jgi:quercetin dioxygenase-like cupin family protein
MHKDLKKLKKLTRELEAEKLIDQEPDEEGWHKIITDDGVAMTMGLLKNKDVAIANTFLQKGCKYPLHKHNQIECLGVYKGEMNLVLEGKDNILKQGDIICIKPNERHSAYAIQDTYLWAVTMPAAYEFPGENK